MKIVFFITTMGHGKGGHFRSLASISTAMKAEGHDVTIVNIGFAQSPIINSLNIHVENFIVSTLSISTILFRLVFYVRSINPDVIHAFDVQSFGSARLVGLILNKKTVLTKCGGPSPKKYFPITPRLTLFSKEDYLFFTKFPRFAKNSNIFLIPERTSQNITQKKELIKKMRQKCNGDNGNKIVFLRVARITEKYFPGFLQIVKLIKKLKKEGIDSCCVLIGIVEDEKILEKLKKYETEKIFQIYTDKEFTEQGAEFLSIADYIIAAGRGVMEASSLGLPILCPTNHTKYPVILRENTFETLFSFNFSERAYFDEPKKIDSLTIDTILNKENEKMGEYTKKLFDNNFNVIHAIPKYEQVYSSKARINNKILFDTIVHSIRVHLSWSKTIVKKLLVKNGEKK